MSRAIEGFPGWELRSCCCHMGIVAGGGGEPEECTGCNGSGSYSKHLKSGVCALYPGGPFLGREKPEAA